MARRKKNQGESLPATRRQGRPATPRSNGLKYHRNDVLKLIQHVAETVYEKKDWHPLQELTVLAAGPTHIVAHNPDGSMSKDENGEPIIVAILDPALRVRCLETLAKYVAPQLKSVELNAATMGERFTLKYTRKVEGNGSEMEGQESDD